MTDYQSTNRLTELLCRKFGVLEEILALSQRQWELIERDEIETLMELLATKQVLLDSLQRFQVELALYRDEDPETRVWQTPQRRQQTQQVAIRCESNLEEIMRLEKECELLLTRRRDEVAADLKAADSAGRAREAYASHTELRGGFQITSDA